MLLRLNPNRIADQLADLYSLIQRLQLKLPHLIGTPPNIYPIKQGLTPFPLHTRRLAQHA